LALIKDRFLVMYYGAVLPAAHVGYLQWAERWSLTPHRMVVDNISKVTFPAYSRLQSKREDLARAIEKSLFFTSLVIFPALVGLVVLAPSLVRVIPRYTKWEPALLALALFSINAMWSSISTTLTNTFAALGKIGINVKLMVLWTTLTWILTPVFISLYGYNGVALASALIASTSIVPMVVVKRQLPVQLLRNLMPPLASAFAMGIIIWMLRRTFSFQPLALLFLGVLGVILYGTVLFLLMGRRLFDEFHTLRRLVRS
jgi:O-antigen/teichoic acid export membrane protein